MHLACTQIEMRQCGQLAAATAACTKHRWQLAQTYNCQHARPAGIKCLDLQDLEYLELRLIHIAPMSSYLRSWLTPLVGTATPNPNDSTGSRPEPPGPAINLSEPSPPASENGLEDDDAPPPFPLPNSIQRSSGTSSQPRSTAANGENVNPTPALTLTPTPSAPAVRQRSPSPDSKSMPPPPLPAIRLPSVSTNGLIASSNASQQRNMISIPSVGGLALPPSTTSRMPNVNTKGKARAKVALEPGHGALDWADLKSSGVDLRVSIFLCP